MTKRRNFSDQFKAAVELEALRDDKTVQEIAARRPLISALRTSHTLAAALELRAR